MKRSSFCTTAVENRTSPAYRLSTSPEPTVTGFGQFTHETRPVCGFTGVDFRASGDVSIRMGEVEAVVIEAYENILPLLKTEVIGNQLIISEPASIQISDKSPIRFMITMKKLEYASMRGSGDINIDGLEDDMVKFDLSGIGTITAYGKVRTLIASLPGMGFIVCIGLEADTVIAHHSGTGEINVRAERSLDANITGVGAINYYGDSANITRTITGYGKINQLPEPRPRYF
jgi:hypothetical protein